MKEQFVDQLIGRMTLAEKIGQMTQAEKYSVTPTEVAEYGIGSVLSGAGANPMPNTPAAWAEMVREFTAAASRSRLGIPLLYGVDAVHGHSNVRGATVFPHNIGLGATHDPELVGRVGKVTAQELVATGVKWDFAPPVSVPLDMRWGRTLEAYSEDTDLVSELGVAFLRGLQDGDGSGLASPLAVLGCVKHFVGDGGTGWGTAQPPPWANETGDESDPTVDPDDERWRVVHDHDSQFGSLYEHGDWGHQIDQGDTDVDEEELRQVHLPPYVAALANGTRSIMVSLSSWRGSRLHTHRHLLTDVLKGELGFDGFLVSDWLGLEYIGDDYYEAVVIGVNAGLDMVMVPHEWRRFIDTLTTAVEAGDVSMDRIDDAVRRILRVKVESGLFDDLGPVSGLLDSVGSPEHRLVAREAVAKSIVVLRNEGALPIRKDSGLIYLAGRAAADIGLQCGGWTIEWRGLPGGDIPGTSLVDAVANTVEGKSGIVYDRAARFNHGQADVGLVVVSEPPYAEMTGDRADLTLDPSDVEIVRRMRKSCEVLVGVVYAGRPLLLAEHLESFDALVMAWLPGTEGGGVADVLFGDVPATGTLPIAWPRGADQIPSSAMRRHPEPPLWPRGYGLSLDGVEMSSSRQP